MSTPAVAVTLPLAERVTPGADPMELRWGIQCGVRDKNAEAWRAGLSAIPFGTFFPVARFRTPEEIHSTDDNPNFPRTYMATKTADSVQLYLGEMLGGLDGAGNPSPSKPNFGIQFGFRGEEDYAKMAVLGATLLPSLSTIRGLAVTLELPNPIGAACDATEVGDFEVRERCPACWMKWIDSPLCKAYMGLVAKSGMDCEEHDPATKETAIRNVCPTPEELSQAFFMARSSLVLGISAMQKLWSTLVDEIEKQERRGLDAYQHAVRKDVHGVKPADKQIAMMREFGKSSQQGNNSQGLEDVMVRMAESQMRTEQLLAEVLGNRSSGPIAVEPEEPAKAAPKAKPGG